MSSSGAGKRVDYGGVAIAAPTTIAYERFSRRPAQWWIGRALRKMIECAGLEVRAVDGLSVSSFTLLPDTVVGLTEHFGLTPRWVDQIPMGGASALVALRRAARAVQARDADIIACIGGDTNGPDSFGATVAGFSRFSQDAMYPYGAAGPNANFAMITRAYMQKYGARREDFGAICVAQRENALKTPHAMMKRPLSMEEYLSARLIADPLRLFDCVMPCAGAEGFLVLREETALSLGIPYVRLLSAIERHNAFPEDEIQLRGGWAVDVEDMWSMSGVRPDEIDLFESYDDYPVVCMMQIEDLGFCRKGEAAEFIRSHTLTVNGSFPHNTSGGQLSVGQAGAAGGYLGTVEAIRQLTGQTFGPSVRNARYALVSGFGMINFDRGVCSAAAIFGLGRAGG